MKVSVEYRGWESQDAPEWKSVEIQWPNNVPLPLPQDELEIAFEDPGIEATSILILRRVFRASGRRHLETVEPVLIGDVIP